MNELMSRLESIITDATPIIDRMESTLKEKQEEKQRDNEARFAAVVEWLEELNHLFLKADLNEGITVGHDLRFSSSAYPRLTTSTVSYAIPYHANFSTFKKGLVPRDNNQSYYDYVFGKYERHKEEIEEEFCKKVTEGLLAKAKKIEKEISKYEKKA